MVTCFIWNQAVVPSVVYGCGVSGSSADCGGSSRLHTSREGAFERPVLFVCMFACMLFFISFRIVVF